MGIFEDFTVFIEMKWMPKNKIIAFENYNFVTKMERIIHLIFLRRIYGQGRQSIANFNDKIHEYIIMVWRKKKEHSQLFSSTKYGQQTGTSSLRKFDWTFPFMNETKYHWR